SGGDPRRAARHHRSRRARAPHRLDAGRPQARRDSGRRVMIGIGVVGYGYWGPNLVRNLCDIRDARLRWVCDLQTERLAGVKNRYPSVEITEDYQHLLDDPQVDAIAVAT